MSSSRIIPAPRTWRFASLDDAYSEVQCNDQVRDGDLVVANAPRTGLTVGFVYCSAWVATVHADHPEGSWEKVTDLDALVADKPEYAESLTLARLLVAQEQATRVRQRAEAAAVADPSEANRRWLREASRTESDAHLAGFDHRAELRNKARDAKARYEAQLTQAVRLVVNDVREQQASDELPMGELEAVADARWFHNHPDPALVADPLIGAYELVADATERELADIGYNLSDLA